jgi:hypothetical protein
MLDADTLRWAAEQARSGAGAIYGRRNKVARGTDRASIDAAVMALLGLSRDLDAHAEKLGKLVEVVSG